MYKKILLSAMLVFASTTASTAQAGNWYWFKNYFYGYHSHKCHSHQNKHSWHYFWARFWPGHRHCDNNRPTANAGPDQMVSSGEIVSLDGSNSTDPDNNIVKYRWKQIYGPRVNISDRRSAVASFTAPDVTETSILIFRLRVKDRYGLRSSDLVKITVKPSSSQPPVADAGNDQNVTENSSVTLDGTGSSDPDNDIASYLWQQTSGTGVVLNNEDTATASFTAPSVDSTETLEFELTVTDSEGTSAQDTVVVSVEPEQSSINVRTRAVDGSAVQADIEFYVDGILDNTLSATTDTDGNAVVNLDADVNFSIRTSADGFATQIVPVRSPSVDNTSNLTITLIQRGESETFSRAGTFTASGSDGAAVNFTTTDFVDADGNPVIGDIQLTITPVDVSQPATLAAFPGEFAGILEGSTDATPIISFGTVEYEFTANGEPINLAPGATADVLIPIYNLNYQDGSPIQVGDTIPLWSLSEDTGIWQQEGNGTVVASIDSPTSLALSGTVSHFSWWNCDVSMNAAQVEVTVLGSINGTATVFGSTSGNIGWRPNQVETTVAVNSTTPPLFIPSNLETCLWAEVNFIDGSTTTTEQQCVTPAPSETLQVTFGTGSSEALDVLAVPIGVDDTVNVSGFINVITDPFTLVPVSVETDVTYTISEGSLPPGITLKVINATQAEVSGVPTEDGIFGATILATDDEGNTDEITVNYNITDDVPPPFLDFGEIEGFFTMEDSPVDLNDFNRGGAATSWQLIPDQPEFIPEWISLDGDTGILTITSAIDSEFFFFQGTIIATNSSGFSRSIILITADGIEF